MKKLNKILDEILKIDNNLFIRNRKKLKNINFFSTLVLLILTIGWCYAFSVRTMTGGLGRPREEIVLVLYPDNDEEILFFKGN